MCLFLLLLRLIHWSESRSACKIMFSVSLGTCPSFFRINP
jgi:hypothetical protein